MYAYVYGEGQYNSYYCCVQTSDKFLVYIARLSRRIYMLSSWCLISSCIWWVVVFHAVRLLVFHDVLCLVLDAVTCSLVMSHGISYLMQSCGISQLIYRDVSRRLRWNNFKWHACIKCSLVAIAHTQLQDSLAVHVLAYKSFPVLSCILCRKLCR